MSGQWYYWIGNTILACGDTISDNVVRFSNHSRSTDRIKDFFVKFQRPIVFGVNFQFFRIRFDIER